jgi:solute carrier family 35 protein C2
MMVAGETAFNALGFALVIASAFFSGFRWGLTQILLLRHPATSNPFSTLFLLTPIMFLSLITIALCIEGPHEIYQGYLALASKHGDLFGSFLLIFPGVLAFCMISSEFALLKRSSVVTLSICGIFKEVVTISAAGIIFHDKLTTVNVTGLVVTISSIAAYNYMKIVGMRSELPEDDSSSRESTPASDTDEGEHSSGDPGDYRRIAHQDSSIISPAPGGYLNDDHQSSSASDQQRSFRVRASGARRGLSISTSTILEDDGPASPLKSAPATITTMAEAGFPHLHAPDHEASPVQSSSSVSPIRNQNFTH